MFWDNYKKLCDNVQKSPSAVAKELGFSNAASTHWKKGKSPNMKTVQAIADYFQVPLSEVIGEDPGQVEQVEEATHKEPEEDPIIEDVLTYARAMMQTDSGKKKLKDITRFMKQSLDLEDLGKQIFNG